MDVQREFMNCLLTTMRTCKSSRRKKTLPSELPRQLRRAYESSKLVQDHRSPAHERPSSYANVSERSLAPPDPLPLSPLALPPIQVGPTALATPPIVDIDTAAGSILPQQAPAHLQNLYGRARENVGNRETAREF